MDIKQIILKIKPIKYYVKGWKFFHNAHYNDAQYKNDIEMTKTITRTDIINFLLSLQQRKTSYAEIGVRNPDDNFNHIKADVKYSIDPGVEFEENPVNFKMTSDMFFHKLSNGEILSKDTLFDVIFIDGLHLAEQVEKDIVNALHYIKPDGFIVLHDCNPPTEWHARESRTYYHSPAHGLWNGTTWKAFFNWRRNPSVFSCCIDTDWGVGILSKSINIGQNTICENPFFEFKVLDDNRKAHLNLIDFDTLKKILTVKNSS